MQAANYFLMRFQNLLSFAGLLFLFSCSAPISPGELTEAHSKLEGTANCKKCHTMGKKVADSKCLECHKEINSRIANKKGYHSSKDVSGKNCINCHSDHHGKKFEIIHFKTDEFNHNLTGYKLEGAHLKKECKDCHKPEFIKDKELKIRNNTYLGLQNTCLNCHADYHQKTLPSDCMKCHDSKAFKPASKFDHNKTKYKLAGKHFSLDCVKCHRKDSIKGVVFQEFAGIKFDNCTNCHEDKHKNKFGQDCQKCHTEESFQIIKKIGEFDHYKTNFPLFGKHRTVDCKTCHKKDYTVPMNYSLCKDCHVDYHQGQFAKKGITPDCKECHTLDGFTVPFYTIDKHNLTIFPLNGSHAATPCNACHKKGVKWSFRNIGKKCVDCHKNVHENYISEKYYPLKTCENCHNESRWEIITFDHVKTGFELTAVHKQQSCRACHFGKKNYSLSNQKFSSLTSKCIECHDDIHYKQFDVNGITDCLKCHGGFSDWQANKFNHNNAAFKLDGKHEKVACAKCHKETKSGQNIFTQYKLKDYRCEACH